MAVKVEQAAATVVVASGVSCGNSQGRADCCVALLGATTVACVSH
ncbi:hypothetical protein WN944_001394 [Citrus x changshan-huyou]|uniref:Uncharacterized protein n=1 Tax=Citrus x changshan-huyou TaxID=2935761 RepID=A0AAP0MKV0_9ROSI